MDEVDPGQPNPTPVAQARPGERLRQAREIRGLSLAEVAARTRVPQRHLEALETGDYALLPSPTYAMGFSKAYARAVDADEVSIAQDVRRELDRLGPRQPEYVPYVTADPARVPSRGVAVIGAGVALAVLILVALWYGSSLFQPQATTTAANDDVATQAVAPKPTAAPSPAIPTGGQVVLTATDTVWLRVYDADDKVLFQGTMKPGDRFEVPAAAKDPMINVGRPDKLAVTLNGSAIPPLGDGSRPIKDVAVSGSAVALRLAGQPAAQPTGTPTAAPRPTRSGGARRDGGNRRSSAADTAGADRIVPQEPAATGNSFAP
jgi:cytoskeletal protein RodZ